MRNWLALMCLALVGCASQPISSSSDAPSRPLIAPTALGADRAATQIVRGAFGSRDMTMNCVVTVKNGTMTVVGLSAMGLRVFTIRYDGQTTTVDNTLPVPAELTPERILADMQLVLWPLPALSETLRKDGWALSEPSSGTRRLRRNDRVVAEVHYTAADPWSSRSWLVNLEHGYTLSIDSKQM